MSDGRSIGLVKVPVGEVAAEAYRAVFGQLGLLLDLAWLPLLVQLAATLIPPLVLRYLPPDSAAAIPDYGLILIEAVAGIVCVNAFGVRWYSVMLFADGRAMPRALFMKAWGRFMVYSVLFTVLSAPSGVVLAVSPDDFVSNSGPELATAIQSSLIALILTVAAVVATLMSLAIARWSLLFPAAAYGQPLSWREAWQLMRGNTWRYMGCLLLTTVPFFLAVAFLENMALALTGFNDVNGIKLVKSVPGGILLDGLCDTVVLFVGFALAASILAGFYRRLVLRRPM